jgi:hypothetical protein
VPGISRTYVNVSAGNNVSCGPSSLTIQQGSSAAPAVVLTGIPSGYNPADFRVKVHVHFDNASSDAYAGLAFYTAPTTTPCQYTRLEIRPDGSWRVVEVVGSDCHDAAISTGNVGAATDFDLWGSMSTSEDDMFVNGTRVLTGGVTGVTTGGDTSLTVHSPSGSSGGVEFSSVQYAMMVNTPDTYSASGA